MSSSVSEAIDVLGIGAVSVDFCGTIGRWPSAGDKERMRSFSVHDGGLVGTALVAVARLGGRAAFVGELGFSEMAERAVQALEQEGVDTSMLVRRRGSEPCISIVLTVQGEGQRTIFSSQRGVTFPLPDAWSDSQWYLRAKVLLIDHVSGRAGIEAARIARRHGVVVVIDAERQTDLIGEALADSDHIVVPHEFACLYTGENDRTLMLKGMRRRTDQTVVITKGSEGCSVLTEQDIFDLPAHPVRVVDTTGCGDVFHGAYALMLARSQSVVSAARFASAAAALSATQVGGRSGIPTAQQVNEILSDWNSGFVEVK